MAKLYGLDNLTHEKEKIKSGKKKMDVGRILTTLLANRANIGFTTGGHTGEDVFYILMDLKTRRLNPKYRHCEDDGESDGL